MRLLLCGGGTAGHINPAIAIAEEARRRDKSTEILFIGRKGGKENDLIVNAGYNVKTINIQGLKRSLSIENFKIILEALHSRKEAESIIKDFHPDVVLGTGGYVCWPVISVAAKMKIPTAIHESNIVPGLTTKMLSTVCDRVFLGMSNTKKYLSKKAKTIACGNPLRENFKKISRRTARNHFGLKDNEILIVSFGGSIGAKRINDTVIDVMNKHSSKIERVKHFHATGERYYNEIISEFKDKENKGCRLFPYIDNMPIALKAADVVICRAGAMTLSEITDVGVAAILIPSPNVTGNHQFKNAKYLSDRFGAIMITENELTSKKLIEYLSSLENDENGRKSRAKKMKSFSTPNSSKIIVEELLLLKNNVNRAVF